MRSVRNRLTWMFLLVIATSVLGTGIFVALLLKASYLDSLTDRLGKEGRLLVDTLNWEEALEKPALFQQQAIKFSHSLDARVTLIDHDGEVLGDSSKPPRELGNLKHHRPVARALQAESKGNYDSVTTHDKLYVFIPVVKGRGGDAQVLGAVRLALELETIDKSLSQVLVSLTLGLLFSFVFGAFMSSRIALHITRPIEEITQVAVDIARNKLHRRVPVKQRDEIGRLATAINRMAAGLRYQLETIRKNERRLTSVIETMESGLLLVDSEEKITLANQAIHRFFKLKGPLLNKSLSDRAVFHDLYRLYRKCLQTGEQVKEELHLYYPEERMMEANLTPIHGERGGMGVVVVLHDITAIRRLEKMRTEFVANVSHELKTPVTSLRGFAETLLEGNVDDPEMRREFLGIIQAESLRLERLIGDLLDLSRIESRKMSLDLERIGVRDLIQTVSKTVEDGMKKNELTFRIEVEKNFQVQVDKDRFSQILINLLSNSMAYTPRGGEVIVSAGKEKDHWWIRVADTGIGIPEEDVSRIFERFYRVDKARSRESGGTGLGLAIVKHLVEAHEGKIHVDSQVGEGTAITLSFPR